MVSLANGFAPFVQVDLMDGVFVPSRSVEIDDLRNQGIEFKWEAHLMVAHPLEYVEPFRDAGASRLIFHAEAVADPLALISRARTLGLEVGVAINPPTPVEAIRHLLGGVDETVTVHGHPVTRPEIAEVERLPGR